MDCLRFREDMLDVLYGEAGIETAERFEAHRATCTDCDEEIAGFRGVRRDLQSWRYETPGTRRLASFKPGLRGLAAAASIAVAFGGGLALARTEVSYREGELRVRFGPGGSPVTAAAPAQNTELAQMLSSYEAEHRAAIQAEIQSVRASLAQQPVNDVNPDMLLHQVQQMIHDSETRQAMMFRSGLTELAQRTDTLHQANLNDIKKITTAITQLADETQSLRASVEQGPRR
jgi:hypothetical protein